MKNLVNKVGEIGQDNLISRLYPRALTGAAKIRKLESDADPVTLKRGTILAKGADGLLGILGENPSGVLTEDFNGDGSTKTFTLTASPLPARVSAKVGDADTDVDYNAQTGVVTFGTAPAAGTKNVHISYENAGADAPYGILVQDVEVTDEADAVAVIYKSGNFNPDACIVAEDYTISDADKDALRMQDIYFTRMYED